MKEDLINELSHAILETIREPLLLLDEDLSVLLANSAFFDSFQVTKTDTLGRSLFELGDRQWDLPELRRLLEKIIPEKAVLIGMEVDHEFPGVGRKVIRLNGRLLKGQGEETAKILLTMQDVTEQRSLEKARDQALNARDELIGVVSHEIQNPLTTILSSLDLLQRKIPQEEIRQRLGPILIQIRQAAIRMKTITSDLLDVTRFEAGRLPMEPVPMDLGPLLKEACESYLTAAESKGIRILMELPSQEIRARVDHDRVLQVLENLLSNAIKFTDAGGEVRLVLSTADGKAQISVSDTGCGIPEAEREHVFERFWQSKHRQYLGTGLGLYIAKGIIEAHGGTIRLISVEGEGSTFVATLPLVETSQATGSVAA